jgi:hypothetical protein
MTEDRRQKMRDRKISKIICKKQNDRLKLRIRGMTIILSGITDEKR